MTYQAAINAEGTVTWGADEGVVITDLPELQRYWDSPDYRAQLEAERDERRAQFNAAMSAHDARERARQEARWAAEEQAA